MPTGTLAWYLRKQNAGLIVTREDGQAVFESFEILAENQAAMSCNGRLLRQFPDQAVCIPWNVVIDQENGFLDSFANALAELHSKGDPQTIPKIRKAKKEVAEIRDTTSPILVTGWLMSSLRAQGQDADVMGIRKHSREQVSWRDTLLPWHRSGLWLLLRVVMRLIFDRAAARKREAISLYKSFMAIHVSNILRLGIESDIETDLLVAMKAKVIQRVVKLGDLGSTGPGWSETIWTTISDSVSLLQGRWTEVQSEDRHSKDLRLDQLTKLDFEKDTSLTLSNLKKHMNWMEHRDLSEHSDRSASTSQLHLTRLQQHELPDSDIFKTPETRRFALVIFENWVEANLQAWLHETLGTKAHTIENLLERLHELITEYASAAMSDACLGDPESQSLMFLVIMELWVALDKLAVSAEPLLKESDPEFPPGLLNPLLLSKKQQMERLRSVEMYLDSRRKNTLIAAFRHFGHRNSLAVRFVDQSRRHQLLLATIRQSAKHAWNSKINEFNYKYEKYWMLQRKLSETPHDQNTEWDGHRWVTQCVSRCKACRLERDADQITIRKLEEPLPEDDDQAKAVVFELNVPPVIQRWRDTTLFILANYLSKSLSDRRNEQIYYASAYPSGLLTVGRTSVLQPGSTVKPFINSHYANYSHHINDVTQSDICLKHAAQYSYYYTILDRDPAEILGAECSSSRIKIPPECSYASLSPYDRTAHLTSWIRGTSHDSNSVMAAQWACPPTMSLEEFREFGHVRSGVRLQWMNMLRQLAMPSVNLNALSVCLLFLQAAHESGEAETEAIREPRGEPLLFRKAHGVLRDPEFGRALANRIANTLSRVKKNSENDNTLYLLTRLTTRLLSIAETSDVRGICVLLLIRLRQLALGWTRDLFSKLDADAGEGDRKELGVRVLKMALICHSTVAVDSDDLSLVLDSEEDATSILQALMFAQMHFSHATGAADLMRCLTGQWYRTCILAEDALRSLICRTRCLDRAISAFWESYRPGKAWSPVDGQPHILESETQPPAAEGGISSRLSFNLLTGLLLVDGKPLDRLPPAYKNHATYRSLFGSTNLVIIPPKLANARFSAARTYKGWELHFSLVDQELVVWAHRLDSPSDIWEFIPANKLKGDFPDTFVDDYTHWIRLRSKEVEFRGIHDTWTSRPDSWRIVSTRNGRVLRKDGSLLVDFFSNTFKKLTRVFEPIEQPSKCNLMFNPRQQSIEVDLPRYQISFTVEKGSTRIRSKQYVGAIIDEDQVVGTLVGLKSMLVLRRDTDQLAQRMVFVPVGNVNKEWTADRRHVTISIHPSTEFVKHYVFHVDNRLGQLADSGGLHSKLYLSYLHAVTSACLPDPLMKRTGTEEALSILSSAAVKSFQRLDAPALKLLALISGLSPKRQYYPDHLNVMETVAWDETLPVSSQHEKFYCLVKEILDHGRRCEMFYSSAGTESPSITVSEVNPVSRELVVRASIRNSSLGVSEYGAEDRFTAAPRVDREYSGRGKGRSDLTERAYRVAKFFAEGRSGLLETFSDAPAVRNVILQVTSVQQNGASSDTAQQWSRFHFAVDSLRRPATVFKRQFCSLHEALMRVDLPRDRLRIGLFLSSLVFAHNYDWGFIQLLMALASVPSMRTLKIPVFKTLDLSDGSKPHAGHLRNLAFQCAKPYAGSPESRMPPLRDEKPYETKERRMRLHKERKVESIRAFTDMLASQWPVPGYQLMIPASDNIRPYVNLDSAVNLMRGAFNNWWDNRNFESYIDSVAKVAAALKPVRIPASPVVTHRLARKTPRIRKGFVAVRDILRQAPPCDIPRHEMRTFEEFIQRDEAVHSTRARLGVLLRNLRSDDNQQSHRDSYIKELEESLKNVQTQQTLSLINGKKLAAEVDAYLTSCREQLQRTQDVVFAALEPQSAWEWKVASLGMQAPRINPRLVMSQLSRHNWPRLHRRWRPAVVGYALAIVAVQRAERLRRALGWRERDGVGASSVHEFVAEASNVGHRTWDPADQPEALLLEAESGLIIREVQEDIARHMQSPPGQDNAVMQLNMGEGKSSVIVPVVAAALARPADDQLVRVVVGKPQMKQMAHVAISRLGGLLDRRIYFLPVSRSLVLDLGSAGKIRAMIQECIRNGGILLVQPEHLLSFKLMALENIHSGKKGAKAALGEELLMMQTWLDRVSRDIVDESDENFSVRFELIYTMGSQDPIEMSPHRWQLIQIILGHMADAAKKVYVAGGKGADGLEFDDGGGDGRQPRIRILDPDLAKLLGRTVASNICSFGLPGFPIHRQSPEFRDGVLEYITNLHVEPEIARTVEDEANGFATAHTKSVLLLLRGLIAGGILAFALGGKRWTVNYGLAPTRIPPTRLAVPYTAHDCPSPRSEFSHPDVVIVLTCLSYYYGTLTDDQMFEAFEALLASDQSALIYSEWVDKALGLDVSYRFLQNINIKDRAQCIGHVFPHLRHVKSVIDYYLSELVFPKEMRQFPKKLSASGWDLAKQKARPLTGFSGTCDSKHMLPLSVKHLNLPEQQHTNATVLLCLLQPENRVVELAPPHSSSPAEAPQKGQNLDAEGFIRCIAAGDDPIQVILDVGAQIIELSNIEAAKIWLSLMPCKDAVVFLDENDNLTTLDQRGRVEPLLTSPFATQLGRCLVFLDQAHTRGIDLRLPDHYRAAVLLGPSVTKDTLVQGMLMAYRVATNHTCVHEQLEE